jgi:AraC-like DNA-binding protein
VTVVQTFPMAAGRAFAWHAHERHQLAWAAVGVLTVITQASTWVLPPTRALWIPAGLPHETRASGSATMRALYIRPDRCPIDWETPTPVGARALLAELIAYLEDVELRPRQRSAAEELLIGLLEPLHMATIELRMPLDPRARDVAEALMQAPENKRTLEQWGRHVGASERTLARGFVAGTGISFGRWRTRLRLQTCFRSLPKEVRSPGRRCRPATLQALSLRHSGAKPARLQRGTLARPTVQPPEVSGRLRRRSALANIPRCARRAMISRCVAAPQHGSGDRTGRQSRAGGPLGNQFTEESEASRESQTVGQADV